MHLSFSKRLVALGFLFLIPASVFSQTGGTPSGDYEVGRLNRPLPGLSWMGAPFHHHDVLVRHGSAYTRRGLFATSFIAAIAGATLYDDYPWYLPGREHVGWCDGYIADTGDWGSESMQQVNQARYNTVKTRIETCTSNKYHLILYTCQEWAAEKLAP
jgi:hypothetical protein